MFNKYLKLKAVKFFLGHPVRLLNNKRKTCIITTLTAINQNVLPTFLCVFLSIGYRTTYHSVGVSGPFEGTDLI